MNCGFPEPDHNNTALAICRQFAKEVGFNWAGGLSLGGGEATNGQPLMEIKRMTRNVIKSLDLTADALTECNPIPQEAIDSMAKPLMPKWVYLFVGRSQWKKHAKKNKVLKTILALPYQN